MPTLAGLDVVTSKWYAESIVDNAFLTNITFAVLWERRRLIQGGTDFVQPVLLTTPTAVNSYQGADIVQLPYDQNLYGAEFTMAQYYGGVVVTDEDDYINMGPPAVINLLETRCIAADMAVRDRVGADLQTDGTGNMGKNIVGLAAAVNNSGTYGNIDRSVFTNWNANVSANGGTPRAMTLDLMNTATWNAIRDNDRPDLYVTNRSVLAKLTTILQPAQRFVANDGFLASIGFSNILYMDRPVVMDEHVQSSPSSLIWGLNTKYLHLYVQEARAFKYIPFQMLPFQNAAVAKTLVALQLVCSSPRSQLVIKDINPSL